MIKSVAISLGSGFLDGLLLVGIIAGIFALLVAWQLIADFLKGLKNKKKESIAPSPPETTVPPKSQEKIEGSVWLFGVGVLTFVYVFFLSVMYVWIFGFSHYSGFVTKKDFEKAGRGGTYTRYVVVVDGKEKSVSETVYNRVNVADQVKQSLWLPWAVVNGQRIPASSKLETWGMWMGMGFPFYALILLLVFAAYLKDKSKRELNSS